MDGAHADEDCFARTEDGLLILEPLLDLPREDDDHLFLVGVRVEVVAVARLERHVEHRELPRTGGRRPADPAEPSPVELLALDVGFVDEPSAHTRSPSLGSGRDRLEARDGLGQCDLGRKPLHARGAEEPDDTPSSLEHVGGVLRLGDRPAVAEDEDVRRDLDGRVVHRLDEVDALVERSRRLRADRASRRQAHVRDEDVGPGLGHRAGVLRREDVRTRQQVELPGGPDHVHLERVAHSRLLEVLAEHAVDQADRREVLDPGEPDLLDLAQEDRHEPERIRAADAGEDGRRPGDREHLARHLHHDRVRVAVGQQARERPPACHPVAARVVDDEEVGAAGLRALRRQPRAGAGADDRPPLLHLVTESRECFLAGHAVTSPAAHSR